MYNSQISGNVGQLACFSCAFKASDGRIRVFKTIIPSVTAPGLMAQDWGSLRCLPEMLIKYDCSVASTPEEERGRGRRGERSGGKRGGGREGEKGGGGVWEGRRARKRETGRTGEVST